MVLSERVNRARRAGVLQARARMAAQRSRRARAGGADVAITASRPPWIWQPEPHAATHGG